MSEVPPFKTCRYSLLLRRILEQYREDGTIRVQGSTYAGDGVDDLLRTWCTNRRVRATRDFAVMRDGVEILGWHDHPREMWVASSERAFFDGLAVAKVIRYGRKGQPPQQTTNLARTILAMSWNFLGWLRLTKALQPTRAAEPNEQR